jgi:hypothetical protein
VKGLYKRARRGEVPAFTGVSDPYEVPVDPEVVVRTDRESAEECAARIIERVEALGYLPRGCVRLEAIVPRELADGLGADCAPLLASLAGRQGVAGEASWRVSEKEWEEIERRLRSLGYLG